MSHSRKKLTTAAYRIAWICPVAKVEKLPAILMLDYQHEDPDYEYEHEDYRYVCGEISGQNVVIGTLPSGYTGNADVAHLTSSLRRSFTNIRDMLLVGIAGGIPHASPQKDPRKDIHLGDIVVGWPGNGQPSFVNYTKGRYKVKGFEPVGQATNPSRRLIGVYDDLELSVRLGREIFKPHIDRLHDHPEFDYPGISNDRLFEPTYEHTGAYGDCSACDNDRIVKRESRSNSSTSELIFHSGTIASGEFVVMDPELRDAIRDLYEGAICFETEAYGASISSECLVIRGISDYADSHKTGDEWRYFAAGRAAVFARALICNMRAPPSSVDRAVAIQDGTEACLKTLTFERRQAWVTEIHDHTEGTTEWLQCHRTYTSWLNREPKCTTPELLCLRGKPGSGKSVLMKSLMRSKPKLGSATPTSCAAFFFARKGSSKEKTSNGLYRSILYQLMEADPAVCTTMLSKYGHKMRSLEPVDGASPQRLRWTTAELKSMLEDVFKTKSTRATIILIDSVDECDEEKGARDVVRFCHDILRHARTSGVTLNVCISSRINLARSEDGHVIVLDQLNSADIRAYVRTRIESHGTSAKKLTASVEDIATKSAGIFLWARLAVDILLDDLDDGRNLKYSKMRLEELPPELEDIYETMLVCPATESAEDRLERLRFFQWVIFANRPMTLREWYTIVGMIQNPPPSSFKEWSRSTRNPVDLVEDGRISTKWTPENIHNDLDSGQNQLMKWIQRVSRGLVEVSGREKETADNDSAVAGQGSMLSDIGESRAVTVIHTSVQDFFRKSLTFGGLLTFDATNQGIPAEQNTIGIVKIEETRRKTIVADGHAAVLQSCLSYLHLEELNTWAERRQDLGSMAFDAIGHGSNRDKIYHTEHIPLALSAASSHSSSSSGSGCGRLPLAPFTRKPGKIMGLRRGEFEIPGPPPAAHRQLKDTSRIEHWLSTSGGSGSLRGSTASEILKQRLETLSEQERGVDGDAYELNKRGNIFERMPDTLSNTFPVSYTPSAASSRTRERTTEHTRNFISNLKAPQYPAPQSETSEASDSACVPSSAHPVQDLLQRIQLPRSERIGHSWEKVLGEHGTRSLSRVSTSRELIVGDIYSFLQYSSDEIFTHASIPELQSLRLSWLVDTMVEAWKHIVILREDVKREANFLQFCMQSATLDRLVIPVLERKVCDSNATDIFIWAMAKGKQDIVQDIVVRHATFVLNRQRAESHSSHTQPPKVPIRATATGSSGYERLVQRVRLKTANNVPPKIFWEIPTGAGLAASPYESFLIHLFGPKEHATRDSNTPISRIDAFSLWKSYFDEFQQHSENRLSIGDVRQLFEVGEAEAPLYIAICNYDSSPTLLETIFSMGEYSDEDLDELLANYNAPPLYKIRERRG